MKNKTIMYAFIICGIMLFGCSKSDNSLLGKWYYAAKDTKKSTGSGCDMKDTTYTYAKDKTTQIYEFFDNGKATLTLNQGGQSYTTTMDYKYENSQLVFTVNGTTMPASNVTNVSSEGWAMEQTNYIWCPSKTAFKETLHYKKY